MFIEFLTPEVFDAIVIANIAVGLLVAGRRFVKDLSRPLPDDAPLWARDRYQVSSSNSSTNRS